LNKTLKNKIKNLFTTSYAFELLARRKTDCKGRDFIWH